MTAGAQVASAPPRSADRLALTGGPAAVTLADTTAWPIVSDADEAAVLEVLRGGALVSDRNEVTAVEQLEERWARHVGVPHCVGVANGTIALQLALQALDVGPGDEVVVPALSFVATAMAVAQVGARPVFVDVDPLTFNLDVDALGGAITSRTVAVVPVHLHGLPADMERITAICRAHGLAVVEDAAQAHGAGIDGRQVGSLGTIGCFSLQATKNLPTCGEGGLVVTADPALDRRLRRLRQFGEDIERGKPRRYLSHEVGHNAKLSSVQAAFTLSQLDRLDDRADATNRTVLAFLERLRDLPGLTVPSVPRPGLRHVWHILRVRLSPEAFGLDPASDGAADAVRAAVHRVLRAEGVPLTRYQVLPLSEQPAFAATAPTEVPAGLPVTRRVIADSLTLQRRHLDPTAGPLLQQYADAFEKVWGQRDVVTALATRALR